jgi:anti-sigma28 factor (negative regulator of flagellin synthesis)
MKINDLSHNISKIGNLETAVKKQKEEETSVNQTTPAPVQSGERVELSNASVGYSNAADKIESLKMKISDGTYNVDSRKIAEKIIQDSLFTALEP